MIAFALVHILLATFYAVLCVTTKYNIKDLRSSSFGNNQDLMNVDLGISETHPNTRVLAYIDINGDKL